LPVTAQVHTGSVWDRIVQVARAERADLIVMSTRGHDTLADRVVGSNTERVVRHAPCPVLVA
jgi:nucleotide-binding universal stress UspA family protein